MTTISTQNPARDDVDAAAPAPGRGWAVAGVLAGVAGFAATILSMNVGAVYADGAAQDVTGIAETLGDKVPVLVAFHVVATLAALLLVPFGFGLHRRLRSVLGADSLVPGIAAFGILGTSLVVLMGTILDTEFIFGVAEDGMIVPEATAVYNHWIGTVPWVWSLTGLTGLALFVAARRGALARWTGIVGLVLGTLSLLLTVLPQQYMAGWTGTVMVTIVALGLVLGDRPRR